MDTTAEASGSSLPLTEKKKKKQKVSVDKEGKKIRDEWMDMLLSTDHTPTQSEKKKILLQIQATNPEYSYSSFSTWYYVTRNARTRKSIPVPQAGPSSTGSGTDGPKDTSFLSMPLDQIEAMAQVVKNFSKDEKEAERPIESFAHLYKCDSSIVKSLHAYVHCYGLDNLIALARRTNTGPDYAALESEEHVHLPTPAPSEPPEVLPPRLSPEGRDCKVASITIGSYNPQLQFPQSPLSPSIPFLPQNSQLQISDHQENDEMEISPDTEEEGPPTELQGFLSKISLHEEFWMDAVLDLL